MPDDLSPLAPPLPIPNRTVKRRRADDSADCPCESRSSSGTLKTKRPDQMSGRFVFGERGSVIAFQFPQASISVMREKEARAAVMRMRMREVVKAEKLMLRLTRLLPLTVASVVQALPVQPWTVKAVTP